MLGENERLMHLNCLISFRWQVSWDDDRWAMRYQKWLMIFETCLTYHEPMKRLHTKTQNTRITNNKGNIWKIKSDGKREDQDFFSGKYTLHWIYCSISRLLLCKPALYHYGYMSLNCSFLCLGLENLLCNHGVSDFEKLLWIYVS